MKLMATKKPNAPAGLPAAAPPALARTAEPASLEPAKVTLADAFVQAGDQALAQVQKLLGLTIDLERLADPEWLADPEHRKIATMLLKLTTVQMNAALGVISGQIRVGTKIREDVEQERRRQAVVEDLVRRLKEPD
jgi:hypothetical protein